MTKTDTRVQPIGLQHLVALAGTDRMSKGGIALPERWWTNVNTGVIECSGPGLELAGGNLLRPVAEPGDIVIFERCDYHELYPDAQLGFVLDNALVAWLDGDEVLPLNDWVLVRQDAPPESEGIILRAEAFTRRPRSGVVVDHGPGKLLTYGKGRGTRRTVEDQVGQEIRGWRVYWGPHAEQLCCGVTSQEWLLVRAGGLIAVEDA